jgi:hypothetical protein
MALCSCPLSAAATAAAAGSTALAVRAGIPHSCTSDGTAHGGQSREHCHWKLNRQAWARGGAALFTVPGTPLAAALRLPCGRHCSQTIHAGLRCEGLLRAACAPVQHCCCCNPVDGRAVFPRKGSNSAARVLRGSSDLEQSTVTSGTNRNTASKHGSAPLCASTVCALFRRAQCCLPRLPGWRACPARPCHRRTARRRRHKAGAEEDRRRITTHTAGSTCASPHAYFLSLFPLYSGPLCLLGYGARGSGTAGRAVHVIRQFSDRQRNAVNGAEYNVCLSFIIVPLSTVV